MTDPLKIYKALADETRLRVMRLLSRGPLNVNEIIGIMQMAQSRVSRHLKILTEAGLVSGRREGTWIYYEEHHNGDSLVADTLAHLDTHEQELGFFAEDMQGLEASIESRKERTTAYFDGPPRCACFSRTPQFERRVLSHRGSVSRAGHAGHPPRYGNRVGGCCCRYSSRRLTLSLPSMRL